MDKYWKYLLLVLPLWALGGFLYLPDTEQSLNRAAFEKLQEPQFHKVFDGVKVAFSGQEATLTGAVALDEEKQRAEKIIREDVRLMKVRGEGLNPVIAVHNQIKVDPSATSRKQPWIIASVFPNGQRVDGVIQSPEQRGKLLAQLGARSPSTDYNNQVLINESSLPASAWDATVSETPDFKSLLASKTGKEQAAIAVTKCDGKWTLLPATATDAEIEKILLDRKISPAEIPHSLKSLRAWLAMPDQAATAKTEPQKPVETKPTASLLPPYIGLTALDDKVSLFGLVGSEDQKEQALVAAQGAYAGSQVDVAGITIDSGRAMPEAPKILFPSGKAPFVAFATFDGKNKLYQPDVFDSEISKDFSEAKFPENSLSYYLTNFRSALTDSGKLTRDDPYLAMITDGKKLIVSGEIADAEIKKILLEKITAANPSATIEDKLQVSSLVNSIQDIATTLNSIPNFTGVNAGIAIARPGQKWRSSVIHSIYFKTGSNRSKDQERAIYQMRRVRELLPNATFEIVGHTDNVGKVDANKKLSLERADSFVAYAGGSGFETSLFTSRGAGPDEPIAPNNSEDGKALNRRVDVMLK